jgi:hypothetical protein
LADAIIGSVSARAKADRVDFMVMAALLPGYHMASACRPIMEPLK